MRLAAGPVPIGDVMPLIRATIARRIEDRARRGHGSSRPPPHSKRPGREGGK